MIYLCIVLYLLGGVMGAALVEAYEEIEGDNVYKETKITFAIFWPLISLAVVFFPSGFVKR